MAPLRQTLSPTANLLRNSRLFSLPRPLPKPNVAEARGAGVIKASATATLPYPTHQAIATTKSSLARGDWGLKRPLPSRSHLIQVSDPVLRMTQLDTIEHVTDFDSASDHVRTRQKWEEMGVPMMKGMAQMRGYDLSGPAPMGAFEIRDDTTSYDTPLGMDEAGLYLDALKDSSKRNSKKAKQFQPFSPPPMDAAVHNAKRWKHDGPWLPGMTADEFTTYLSREIHKRRAEFNTYLREFVKNEIYTTRQLASSKAGETAPMDIAEAEAWQRDKAAQWSHISEEDIVASIKSLRKETANNPLTSKLVTKLILPFLRLPSMKFKYTAFSEDASSRDIDQYQFDQESAPLSTHPSAGLGYLRTKAYLSNHPILGPQSSQIPVSARVVQPRTTSTSKESYARLGIAGFVANDQFRSTDTSSSSRIGTNARDVETIDIDTPGGKKIMVQPMFGSVTNDGRIHIKLKRSTGAEVQVARGELEDRPPVREGFDADPLKGLKSLMGKGSNGNGRVPPGARGGMKGVEDSAAFKELSAESERAKQLSSFLDQMTPEGKGKPAPGFPGVADALRESKT